jgi:O-antigen ligase
MVIETFSKTILFTYLLIAATRTVRDLYTLMWSYIVSSGILAFFALFVFKLQKYDGSSVTHQRLSNLYTWDANDVVLVILIGLVLALLVLQVVRDPTRRLVLILTVVGIGATAARSGSRGGFLGLVAVGLGLLFLTRGVAFGRKVLVIGVAAAGMLIWAPEGYWRQMQTITDTKNDYNYTSLDGRKKIAKRGWGYMRERPFFGVGIANFQKAECTISDKARNAPPGHGVRCSAPHNSFVQAGAETGVPGVVLWSSVLFGGIVSLRRWGRRLPARFRVGTEEQRFLYHACQYLPVALLGFAVTSYFLTFAWMEPYYILTAFVVGTLSLAQTERRKHLARRRSLLLARRRQLRAASALRAPAPQPAA